MCRGTSKGSVGPSVGVRRHNKESLSVRATPCGPCAVNTKDDGRTIGSILSSDMETSGPFFS